MAGIYSGLPIRFNACIPNVTSCESVSGIHSAIHGKIRPGNVRGLRTGDKRHQRGNLFNMPIAVERCGGLLRHRPLARRGIQIRVDGPGWILLTVMPRLPTSLDNP